MHAVLSLQSLLGLSEISGREIFLLNTYTCTRTGMDAAAVCMPDGSEGAAPN